MKKLKNYLHLYLGCEVQCVKGEQSLLREYNISQGQVFRLGSNRIFAVLMLIDYFKLILRPLSSMTEEESLELEKYPMAYDTMQRWWSSEQFVWLLSKGFDLFGLIEAGLAIDKTLMK